MIAESLGPYRLVEELGSGSTGIVYLAQGPEGRVAVKVLHPHLVERPGARERFRREAAAGSRVRHENVVRTLGADIAVVDGVTRPYLVAELVEGRTLRVLRDELGTVPEALVREIARAVAAGLAAIHGEGLVHGDLKPENVLITRDHRVRIMDLGVARPSSRPGAEFAGSLLYAAPEQLAREAVGPAADLYSLGLTLYELATGCLPFRGETAEEIVAAKRSEDPAPAAQLCPDVSPFLSEVLAALLARDPAGRFASAADLRGTLEAGELSGWWADRERALVGAPGRLPAIPVRRTSNLHGREEQLAVLREAWEAAAEGRGRSVLVVGEAGIGKTRLVDAFLRELEGRDAHLLYGSSHPTRGRGAFSSAILGHLGRAGLEEGLRRRLPSAPSLVPAYAAAVLGTAPPPGCDPLPEEAPPALTADLLRSLAAEKPLVWVVEDLHLAEPTGRKIALSLARALPEHRALLVLTARPGLPEAELEAFRAAGARELSLPRLTPEEVAGVLRDAFPWEHRTESLAPRIAERSEGVPYLVFELVRGLEEGLFLAELSGGPPARAPDPERIEAPGAVTDLIRARLEEVAERDRRLLDVGAVLGVSFDPDLLARVHDESRVDVLTRLAALERRTGLVRAAGGSCRFDHHLVREVLLAELPRLLREEVHTLLADAFAEREGAGEEPSGEEAVFLATHHLQGARPWDALPSLAPALEHLGRAHRNEAVLDLATRALEVPDLLTGRSRIRMLEEKAARLDLLGRREDERRVLEEAAELARADGDPSLRAATHQRLGVHLSTTGRFARAREHLERALDLARRAGDRGTEAAALGTLGNVHQHLGDPEKARGMYERQLRIARATGDRDEEAKAKGNLAHLLHRLSRYEEARRFYEEALALFRDGGNRRGEVVAIGNLGSLFFQTGRFGEARERFERHLALCRDLGYRRGEGMATGNLGTVYQALGRPARALDSFERDLEISREVGDRRGEYQGLGHLGLIHTSLGNHARGRALWETSLAMLREAGDRGWEAHALVWLGLLAEQEGKAEEAERLALEAIAICRETGFEDPLPDALVNLGRSRLDLGRGEEAREALSEAIALGRRLGMPGATARASAWLAQLPGEDPEEAVRICAGLEARLEHAERLETRYALFLATRDRRHLAVAHRLLEEFREHAPEEHRAGLTEKVPLHHRIAAAWEEGGAAG